MEESITPWLLERAQRVTPGGVNTSIRRIEFLPVWQKAEGSKIYDVEGKEYIDYHAAFGPSILGHCHPRVNQKVIEARQNGKFDWLKKLWNMSQAPKWHCSAIPDRRPPTMPSGFRGQLPVTARSLSFRGATMAGTIICV